MKKPVALIGTAEKGYLSVELSVNVKGGHSSMPARETAIDIIAKSITKLRENNFPAGFPNQLRVLLKTLAPKCLLYKKWLSLIPGYSVR